MKKLFLICSLFAGALNAAYNEKNLSFKDSFKGVEYENVTNEDIIAIYKGLTYNGFPCIKENFVPWLKQVFNTYIFLTPKDIVDFLLTGIRSSENKLLDVYEAFNILSRENDMQFVKDSFKGVEYENVTNEDIIAIYKGLTYNGSPCTKVDFVPWLKQVFNKYIFLTPKDIVDFLLTGIRSSENKLLDVYEAYNILSREDDMQSVEGFVAFAGFDNRIPIEKLKNTINYIRTYEKQNFKTAKDIDTVLIAFNDLISENEEYLKIFDTIDEPIIIGCSTMADVLIATYVTTKSLQIQELLQLRELSKQTQKSLEEILELSQIKKYTINDTLNLFRNLHTNCNGSYVDMINAIKVYNENLFNVHKIRMDNIRLLNYKFFLNLK